MADLLISMDFPPHKDGITTLAAELAKRLGASGGLVVIGPSAPGAAAFDRGQPYIVYRSPLYEWGYAKLIPLIFLVPYVVLRHRIRRIIATNIGYGGVLAYALSRVVPLTYIITAQGYEFLKFKDNAVVRKIYLTAYAHARRIIACSGYVKELLAGFGVDAARIEVAYPGVDMDRYRPVDSVPDEWTRRYGLKGRKVLLTVGRLVERKGHAYVLRALPRVLKEIPGLVYLIVGKGPEKPALERTVAELGLGDTVRFLGEVPDGELLYLYNACDAFVMPSRNIERDGHVEGFGIVFVEASACGKPVIGGRHGGIPEAILDGETGLLVDPSDEKDIAEKIIAILKDPSYAKTLGGNGLRRARAECNWDSYAERFRRALEPA
ncbi:MAG TPA: glycosyltransferase family 4 protein [bacterium]|nr:glycosyltransferase family 4 protein [bacterium]